MAFECLIASTIEDYKQNTYFHTNVREGANNNTHKSACIYDVGQPMFNLERGQVEVAMSSHLLTCSRKSFKTF